jgi:hypothetical protein
VIGVGVVGDPGKGRLRLGGRALGFVSSRFSAALIGYHIAGEYDGQHTVITRLGDIWTNHLLKNRYEEANLVLVRMQKERVN